MDLFTLAGLFFGLFVVVLFGSFLGVLGALRTFFGAKRWGDAEGDGST
ncbi:hypothetical protein ACFQH6_07305 [Halobacteriaceae archaeon GCM10025711]